MKSSLAISLLLLAHVCQSQYVVTDSIKVGAVENMSVDWLGNIYLADASGNIDKYSVTGERLARFSPSKKGKITVLEAWNPLKIFVFYAGLQQYAFLDRFLVNDNRFGFGDISNFVGMSTMSLDNNIWLVDYVDFSLKKYNINFNQIEINRPFDLVLDPENYDITYMREYQNLLFVSDNKTGILVFDNLGNYLKTIKGIGIQYFNFNGDQIHYILNHQLVQQNIYSGAENKIQLADNIKRAIIFKNYHFYLSDIWLKIAIKQ
ncbi:MAG TPA: hypothetical protein PKL31_06310 [Fulvivirga sp.]|nr:hypothetical protein [Fulvivirga sp.]